MKKSIIASACIFSLLFAYVHAYIDHRAQVAAITPAAGSIPTPAPDYAELRQRAAGSFATSIAVTAQGCDLYGCSPQEIVEAVDASGNPLDPTGNQNALNVAKTLEDNFVIGVASSSSVLLMGAASAAANSTPTIQFTASSPAEAAAESSIAAWEDAGESDCAVWFDADTTGTASLAQPSADIENEVACVAFLESLDTELAAQWSDPQPSSTSSSKKRRARHDEPERRWIY
ncbi:hypothetical protein MMC06_000934 [Schaereria dolodes]|nr:hypothetical protein [Schaereria dolodes]